MSELEDFLGRWSRRKRAAAEAVEPVEGEKPTADASPAAEQSDAPAAATRAAHAAESAPQAPPEAEFDVSSLPSIESIAADTDISAFLKPGVPAALRHAALRRAWSADPAIRDFKGLAENDWDFNDPDSIPGFGKLAPDFDARKLVARVFGEELPDEPASADPPPAAAEQPPLAAQQSDDARATSTTAEPAAGEITQNCSPAVEQNLVRREERIASQQDEPAYSSDQDKPRRHGGALPHVFPEY